jgi:PPOX class probable F420-dependent enzyme
MIELNTKFGRKVKRRLKNEQEIWLTSTGSDGSPQPRPVWFWWDGETFLIYSQIKAHKFKHLTKNNKVALNLNTGNPNADVVVFTGTAAFDTNAPAPSKHKSYFNKYKEGIKDLKMTPSEFDAEYPVAIRVKPDKLRGW